MTSQGIDNFSLQLLEEAKRFLELAQTTTDDEARTAFLHASLLLGFSALEAHLNGVAGEMLLRSGLSVLDESILGESDFKLSKGAWKTSSGLKIYRLEDRLHFLFARFGSRDLPTSLPWWSVLKSGLSARNSLVHPRDALSLSIVDVGRYLVAIVDCLEALYRAIYSRGHPSFNRQLDSSLAFGELRDG